MTAHTIVVDALSARMGGGLSYLCRQLAAVRAVAPDRDLQVLASPWNHRPLSEAVDGRVELVRVRGLLSRLLYEQTRLPRVRPPKAVLYCPGNLVPLWGRHLPTVLTVQNPNLFGVGRHQVHNHRLRRRVQIATARASVRRADRIVVISHALRHQLLDDDLVDDHRVRVVSSGGPELVAATDAVEPDGFPFGGFDYVLALANDAPHKNHDAMVAGWGAAFATEPDQAPGLVIAGRMSCERRREQRHLVPPGLRSRLIHLGGVTDRRQVSWLLRHATALVAIASLEAHPLTPAEAGLAGCPLILSDIPAHREVAGGHAVYVPLGDRAALAVALRSVAHQHARSPWTWPITWADNARQLLDVFDEVVA